VVEDIIGVGTQAIWAHLAELARLDLRDLAVEETIVEWTQLIDSGCAARAEAQRVGRHDSQTQSVTAVGFSNPNDTPVGSLALGARAQVGRGCGARLHPRSAAPPQPICGVRLG
jgi:hypothetical protein